MPILSSNVLHLNFIIYRGKLKEGVSCLMELIDNKSKRWINILKLLVSKNKWWSLQEISNEHIGSVRAIQSDLEQMKSFQTENGEPLIHIKPRQGISICNTQTIRVDYYIKEILKDTIEIRLIDGIFRRKQIFL